LLHPPDIIRIRQVSNILSDDQQITSMSYPHLFKLVIIGINL